MRIDPAGIIPVAVELHVQWPSDTTMPTWAMSVVMVLTSVTLKRIGVPPGRTVVGSCAVMVTSMPPADPWDWVPGLFGAGEVSCGRFDGDADWLAVVVPELLGVPELVVVPELEQPTRATTIVAPTNVAATLEEVLMTICALLTLVRCWLQRSGFDRVEPCRGACPTILTG